MSKYSLALCYGLIFLTAFVFYPKWNKDYNESTFGWDVLGYYLYLPAAIIHQDLEQLSFVPEVLEEYKFTSDFQQAYRVENGNYILKYSLGQSISYLPFFAIAHVFALNSDFPADGFSRPYQFMISLGTMLIAFLGLFYLRKVLLLWFSDIVVALTLFVLVFASNYFEYTAINGALTHNYLFTLYCLLLWFSIKLYETPTMWRAVIIGLLIGLASLTRPTEIIALILPLLWGVSNISITSLKDRFDFILKQRTKLAAAMIVCLLIGSIQLIYWKLIGGSWFIYSYQNEEFTWLHPHVYDSLLGFRTGWLVYSPAMWFSLIGFYFLYRKNTSLFWPCFIFILMFTYLVTAWDNWWYGGGLGLRAMVQSYPILAIPMAACFEYLIKKKIGKILLGLLLPLLIYLNFWLTYNAHEGHQYHAGQMTKAYFLKTVGRLNYDPLDLRLLDTDEYFSGERNNIQTIYENDFEQKANLWNCSIPQLSQTGQLCVQKTSRYFNVPFDNRPPTCKWLRAEGNFYAHGAEYDFWKMAKVDVSFFSDGNKVKNRMIRPNRLFPYDITNIYFDIKVPDVKIDSIQLSFYNGKSDVPFIANDVKLECFE